MAADPVAMTVATEVTVVTGAAAVTRSATTVGASAAVTTTAAVAGSAGVPAGARTATDAGPYGPVGHRRTAPARASWSALVTGRP